MNQYNLQHGSKYPVEIKVKPSFRNSLAFGLTDQSLKLNSQQEQLKTTRGYFFSPFPLEGNRTLQHRLQTERNDRLVFAHFTIDGLDCDDSTCNRINSLLLELTKFNSIHTVLDLRLFFFLPIVGKKKKWVIG